VPPLHIVCNLALEEGCPKLWHETEQLGKIVDVNVKDPLDNETTVSCKTPCIVCQKQEGLLAQVEKGCNFSASDIKSSVLCTNAFFEQQ